MKCKAFDVEIELEIQAVTCPGVWLCPNGNVTVQIYLLGLCTQTCPMIPVFPLLCHEKFSFRKKYPNIQNLFELDHKLNNEVVYMELIQWEDCDHGNVLATFKTSLIELLYPFPKQKGVIAGTDVDLLMEATRKFPGIISPKIEISSKITVKETLYSLKKDKANDITVVNPKIISSKCVPKRNIPVRQKKVCHSYKYHRSKLSSKKYASNVGGDCEYLYPISKSPENSKSKKKYLNKKPEELTEDFITEKISQLRNSKTADAACTCNDTRILCPLCAKYKCYFSKPCICNHLDKVSKPDSGEIYNEDNSKQCSVNPRSPRSKAGSDDKSDRLLKSFISTRPVLSPREKNEINEEETCTQKFYKNLEQFYKQLYMHAHYKLKNERCKCNK